MDSNTPASSVPSYQSIGRYVPDKMNLQDTMLFLCGRVEILKCDLDELPNSRGC